MAAPVIAPFANHLPVAVRFGPGVSRELPEVLEGLLATRWAAVVDPALLDLPAVRELVADASVVLPVTPGEPTIASVDALGARLAEAAIHAVVAIGGGSALDSAKGARLVAEQGGSIARFCWPGEPEPIPRPATALVTVPTTSGTGSEVTGGIVLHDPARGIKVAAPSPLNRAQAALVDPDLTVSLPPGPTLHGGLDVVAQAIGAVVAVTRTPVADAVALEALRIARDALPAVVRDPSDRDARGAIAAASLMAGLAMNLSEVGSEHSLGHALGARAHVPHGLSVAVVLLASMEQDRLAVPEAFERIADALGAPGGGPPDGSRAVAAVAALLDAVGCPTLADLGVTDDDVAGLADTALAGWIPVAPGRWEREDVEAAYRRALAETRAPAVVA